MSQKVFKVDIEDRWFQQEKDNSWTEYLNGNKIETFECISQSGEHVSLKKSDNFTLKISSYQVRFSEFDGEAWSNPIHLYWGTWKTKDSWIILRQEKKFKVEGQDRWFQKERGAFWAEYLNGNKIETFECISQSGEYVNLKKSNDYSLEINSNQVKYSGYDGEGCCVGAHLHWGENLY